MNISTKTKREKLAEREEAILSAAKDIFHDKGMRAAKMSEIAAAAGIAEGTLYLYFKNKEALFGGVVSRHWMDLTSGARAEVQQKDAPRDQLEALASYTLQRIIDDWKLFELSFVLEYRLEDGDRKADDRKGYVGIFDRVIARGRDRGDFPSETPTRLLRDLYFGTMEYAVRSTAGTGRKADVPSVVAMLMTAMEACLGGVSTSTKPDLAERIEAAVDRLERHVDS